MALRTGLAEQESRRIRIVLDRRHKAVRAIWKNMSRHQRRQLNRAAINANDQGEPSSREAASEKAQRRWRLAASGC